MHWLNTIRRPDGQGDRFTRARATAFGGLRGALMVGFFDGTWFRDEQHLKAI
jgi:hypothetical protein